MKTEASPARLVVLGVAVCGVALGGVALARYVQQWPVGYHPFAFALVVVAPPLLVGLLATPLALVGRRKGVSVRPSGWVTALGAWAGGAGFAAGVVWLWAPLWPTHVMATLQMSPPSSTLPAGPSRVAAFGGDDGALSFDAADGRFAVWSAPSGALDVAWTWRASEQRLLVVDCGGGALAVRSVAANGKSVDAYRATAAELSAAHVDPCTCVVLADGARVICTGKVRLDPNSGAERTYFLVHAFGDPAPPASHTLSDAQVTLTPQPSPDGSRVVFAEACGPDGGHVCLESASLDGTGRAERDLGSENVCSLWPSPDGRLAFVTTPGCDTLSVVDAALTGEPSKVFVLAPKDRQNSPRGVSAVAWSPDGGSLAVVSDHDGPGCSGREGVTSCSGKLFVLLVATGVSRNVSPRYVAARALSFTP